MVLGKLPVPGCPTNLDDSRARAYCRHMTPKLSKVAIVHGI